MEAEKNFRENSSKLNINKSLEEAVALPSNTKIILTFNKELQPIGQAAGLFSDFLESLGADYSQFPICKESWKHVNKAKKEHAYDMIKDDAGGNKAQNYATDRKELEGYKTQLCYKETRTFEENLKHHPSRIEESHWKWFLEYRQKEETKKKCNQNALNWSKKLYTHIGGSKTLAKNDDVEKEQRRPVGRRELLSSLIRKKWLLYPSRYA
ncbi:hypothetical protein Ahy_B05g077209 [Arachis hypogaea]|uniref:Uncharacterized protein n=1 Tax=Arachis hypogaea TaxID=3818 RepID=A0A444Z4L3_ARAHY|nr:hypothetical protein Ahy_B05g077209 [Arachis hypogaea]